MKKTMAFFVLVMVMTLSACDGATADRTRTPVDTEDLIYLTLDELNAYDGRDGTPAYIAVEGVIYDVTNSPQWPNGLHRGQHQAGQDLTDALAANTRHGAEMLDNVPKIGYLLSEDG